MRVKNVEKFRDQLYEAIKDQSWWDVDTDITVVVKHGYDYVSGANHVTERPHYEVVMGEARCVSLPHPCRIKNIGMYITVDEMGINFWKDNKNEFKYSGCLSFEFYKSRLSMVMALANMISRKIIKKE